MLSKGKRFGEAYETSGAAVDDHQVETLDVTQQAKTSCKGHLKYRASLELYTAKGRHRSDVTATRQVLLSLNACTAGTDFSRHEGVEIIGVINQ